MNWKCFDIALVVVVDQGASRSAAQARTRTQVEWRHRAGRFRPRGISRGRIVRVGRKMNLAA